MASDRSFIVENLNKNYELEISLMNINNVLDFMLLCKYEIPS